MYNMSKKQLRRLHSKMLRLHKGPFPPVNVVSNNGNHVSLIKERFLMTFNNTILALLYLLHAQLEVILPIFSHPYIPIMGQYALYRVLGINRYSIIPGYGNYYYHMGRH